MKTEAEIRTHMESLEKIGPVDRSISDSYFRWIAMQGVVAVLRWVLNDDPPEGAAKR